MPCIKTAISIDADLYHEIERVSGAFHISRSGFFAEAARLMLEKKKNLDLLRQFNDAASADTEPAGPSSRSMRRYYGRKVVDRW